MNLRFTKTTYDLERREYLARGLICSTFCNNLNRNIIPSNSKNLHSGHVYDPQNITLTIIFY
jgi:hypothetical protein